MFGITLQRPEFLLLGLLAAIATGFFWRISYQTRKAARASYGEPRLVDRFSAPLNARREALCFGLYALSLVLIGLSAAAPVISGAAVNARAGTVDVVVVSDVSRSMASEEYRRYMPDRDGVPAAGVRGSYGSRLDFVKYLIESRIMPAAANNRLGIVTYSGLGFTQAELTFDFGSLRWILRHWMPLGGAPGNGSDFASGLLEAQRLFADAPTEAARQRVIVLFSDGGFTGSADALSQAIAQLRARNIALVIIGIGGEQPNPIPLYSASGEMTGNMMRDGQIVLTRFEEQALLDLRETTGGQYIRVPPGGTLDIEWASVLAGQSVEIGQRHLFNYPLCLALALLGWLQMRGLFLQNLKKGEKV